MISEGMMPKELVPGYEYYRLEKVIVAPVMEGDFSFASAAIMSCRLCGCVIDSMGGPGDGQVCKPCGDLVRSGQAVGAIKWDAP